MVVAGLFLTGLQVAYAQQESTSFAVDVVSVRGNDDAGLSRLDLYTAIPHANLRFLKTGDAFTARYEVTASVYMVDDEGRRQRLIENSVWTENVSVLQFGATQSYNHVAHASHSLALDPGPYLLELKLQDLASEEVYHSELLTEVRSFAGPTSLSDLILVSSFDALSHTITPLVRDRVFVNEPSFRVFYELYADAPRDVRIRREVIRTPNSRGLPLLRWIFRRWQDDEKQGEITFVDSQALQLAAGRNPVVLTIPASGFEAGEYLIRVIAEDDAGNQLDVAERAITMEWADEAEYQGRDIDMAIAQLRYIAKPRELREIREGETPQERRERFLEFWEKRDPTPNTPSNERMEEYYLRIDYANRHYTGNSNGWETDRGYTLVLYGEPDEVDSSSADLQFKQPYEVWHYRRIGRQFVFLDQNGNGDFKLIVPTWNERNAIR